MFKEIERLQKKSLGIRDIVPGWSWTLTVMQLCVFAHWCVLFYLLLIISVCGRIATCHRTYNNAVYTGNEHCLRRIFLVLIPDLNACDRLSKFIHIIQGGPKKVSHHQFFKKIVLKISNEIRFLRKVVAW